MTYAGYNWQGKGKWKGINAYPVTPLTPELKVDYESYRNVLRYLLQSSVSALGLNGHTAEGEFLTIEERKQLLKIAQEEVQGRIPISCAVYGRCMEEAIGLAQMWEKLGADLIMILSPNLYLWDARDNPKDGIIYHRLVARSVKLPCVFHQVYNTQDEYPSETLAQIFKENDNLVGVKLANGFGTPWAKLEADMEALRGVGRDNIGLFPGTLSMMCFLWGCDGAFTGYCNFDGTGLVELWNAVQRGDLEAARKIHFGRIRPIEAIVYARPAGDLMARYKEVTRLTGLIPCSSVRPPKSELTEEEKRQIYEATKKCGLIGANAATNRKAA